MAYKSRGFIQTGGLLKAKIRAATETRGFAETRLLQIGKILLDQRRQVSAGLLK